MNEALNHFVKNGWIRVDLIDSKPIFEARDKLQQQLAKLLGKKIDLEDYHKYADDDAFHTDVQVKMTEFFRAEKFAKKVIEKQVDFFKHLVGMDLLVQHSPYLRMTRPQKKQDNVGYHRDTFYGGTPYEVSVILPFVELDSLMALKVMSGSHTMSERLFPVVQHQSNIEKGSDKHKLGFLYAPKLMSPETEEKMEPIPLKLGQILIFCLSTVHGTVENKGIRTRWSSDVRVMNALAPVDLSGRKEYYEPLTVAPVTQAARQYLIANENQ